MVKWVAHCPPRSGAAEPDRWRDPTSRPGARPRGGATEGPGSRLRRNKYLSEEQTLERPCPNELTPNKKLTVVGQRVCCRTSGHNALRQTHGPPLPSLLALAEAPLTPHKTSVTSPGRKGVPIAGPRGSGVRARGWGRGHQRLHRIPRSRRPERNWGPRAGSGTGALLTLGLPAGPGFARHNCPFAWDCVDMF